MIEVAIPVAAPTEFSVRVHGKWIVAGEHAVLRGQPALAFPVYGKYLELKWTDSESFSAKFSGESGAEFQLLFSGVFDRALEILKRSGDLKLKRGKFEVESTLPVGAGLGASAALSVAVGRWFVAQNALPENGLFEFCRELENLFHGESSGVDVAVAIESRGLHFERGPRENVMLGFDPAWQPTWYISSSGARGITSECVAKVKRLMVEDPSRGEAIDRKMGSAVLEIESALRSSDSSVTGPQQQSLRLETLKRSIDKANECFEEWELADGELGRHLAWLRESGAIAVKPTGSGGGGYALSLWRERPSKEIEERLIPVFKN